MISLLCEWRGNGGSYCVVFKPAFESNNQSVATRMNSTTPLNPTQSQKFPLLKCDSGTPCRCFIVPLCVLCVSVSSSSLGRTPTTRCSRRTTATVIWASRRRTWAAAGWSDTSCGGRTFSWGQYSPVRHPTALLWRSYSAADGRRRFSSSSSSSALDKSMMFLIVQRRAIFHRVSQASSSRMCHFHLVSHPRNFCL